MENTTPFFFNDSNPKFFIATHGKAIGPLTSQDIFERIKNGEIGLLHFCWCEPWSEWKRICEEKEFAVLIPQKPITSSIEKLRTKWKERKETLIVPTQKPSTHYYLYSENAQYGPFSKAELVHVFKSHRVNANSYLWTQGQSAWKQVTEFSEFARYFTPQDKSGLMERRKAPRQPFVARLFVHDEKHVVNAVCRDISVGGMQILTNHIPGPVGSHIKLNVSPGEQTKIKGFVAHGVIVRHLEDRRGFSFRFTKLSQEAQNAIEKYVAAL